MYCYSVCCTSLCSSFIPPLHQQEARTLREEGQHTELQQRRQRQEGKQVVPPGLLQSKHQNDIKASDMEELQKRLDRTNVSYSCCINTSWNKWTRIILPLRISVSSDDYHLNAT